MNYKVLLLAPLIWLAVLLALAIVLALVTTKSQKVKLLKSNENEIALIKYFVTSVTLVIIYFLL